MPRLIGQSEEFSGSTFELNASPMTLGRVEDNQIEINHNSVSSSHAELVFDENDYVVRDLESTNGTRVNGERINEQKLRKGDNVRFGNIEFIYDSEYSPPAQALPEPSARVQLGGTASQGRPEDFKNAAPLDVKKGDNGKSPWTMIILLGVVLALAGIGYFCYALFLIE